ncbi:MAG TPA: apolipoprotein N-acyltransferase [Terriglobales bacterium]|nr:apolipoprotein N-acyltransferase [Terriglobales bacterium]
MRWRYLAAVVAGFVLAASFPLLGMAGLAWIGPGLFLAAAWGKSGGESFRIGYIAALTHYLVSLYWILLIPYRWLGIPLGPATGWLALSGFVALFPAAWTRWTLWRASALVPAMEEGADAGRLAGFPARWPLRLWWALTSAAAWVAMEMVLARIFGGFPWNLLGASQHRLTPLIQISSWTGIYGVSFLVVWFAVSLFSAGMMLLRQPERRGVWVAEMFLPILTVALVFHFGERVLRTEKPAARTLRVEVMQPSIPQTVIWDETADEARFTNFVRECEASLTNRIDLLIWPESGIPRPLRYHEQTFQEVTGLARRHHVWMIVGSEDIEPAKGSRDPEKADYFNASFLISPEGEIWRRYCKRSLVIFGEYVPGERWLPFIKWFTPWIQGSYTPGTGAVAFNMKDLDASTSVLICFEDVFPQLGRTGVNTNTDFLVNITNDGWFGEGAEQWQHGLSGLFRAVENRVPLVRCSNNGLSCWIDEYGRMREILRDKAGSVYGEGAAIFEIPLAAAGQGHALTFYTQHGDVFGWSCFGLTAGLSLCPLARRRLGRGISPGNGHQPGA